MKGAMVIFVAMVVIGIVLYLLDVFYYRRKDRKQEKPASDADATVDGTAQAGDETSDGECCGMHLVCEKTSLSPVSDEIIYYDDEELDRFKGREPGSYSDSEIEEFRDVMETLLPQDVAGWARSIQLREIQLPEDVRDELLMLVIESRQQSK